MIWISIGLGVALAAPSLTTGTAADDWLQWLVARGDRAIAGLPTSRFDLFSFAGHDPRTTPLLVDAGMFPWWTDPAVKLAFWRPLVSLTHVVDWTLWPRSGVAMHLQNLAWFALALAAVAAFYRRFIGGWAAGLATLLYSIDDAHAPAVAWIANRNAMVAVALSVPVLLAHDRWRARGWRAGAVVAPALLAVALLAGESSLAIAAYLAAYALFVDRAPRALRSLLPYLAVIVAWRVVYHALGYGTAHSGIYLDPGSEPIAFLRALPSRAAFLLAGQFALPWSDLAPLWPFVSPHAYRVALGVAVATVIAIALMLTPLCRRDATARFFAAGLLGAVVPICSTFPADRLLWFVGIGAMGLLARFIADVPRAWWSYVVVSLLLLIHVALALLFLPIRARTMATMKRPLVRASESLPPSPELAGRTVVIANPPSDAFAGYVVIYRAAFGQPMGPMRWLATGQRAVTITRVDERTLRVRRDGGFVDMIGEQLLRSPSQPFTRGQRITMARGMTVVIDEVEPDGRPAEVRVTFDRALEDKSYYWVAWKAGRYVAWSPPPVGKSETLMPIDFLEAVFKP